MPFLQKSNSKGSQYYVEFLGWMECYGVQGERYTQPVINELRRRQNRKSSDKPPKLTILVTKEELQISQDVDSKKKSGTKTVQFPKIPGRDVTFVHQASRPSDGRPDDIVACIYLGYMPRTNRCVHVHVYRFMDSAVAADFASKMAFIVSKNSIHIQDVERKLVIDKQIEPPVISNSADIASEPHTTDSAVGSASSGYSGDDNIPAISSHKMDPDLESLADVLPFDNVNDELRYRMQSSNPPVLYPPIDYDTISRRHGNLIKVEERRCTEGTIVGEHANKLKQKNGPSEIRGDKSPSIIDSDEKYSRNKISDAPFKSAVPSPPIPAPFLSKEPAPLKADTKPYQSGHRRQLSQGSPSVTAQSESVYPPKKSSPPMSPRVYRQAKDKAHNQLNRQSSSNSEKHSPRLSSASYNNENSGPVLKNQSLNETPPFIRQSSSSSVGEASPFNRQNSNSSNSSLLQSQISDHDKSQEEGKIMYYKGPKSEDLYALPSKLHHRHSQHVGPSPPPSSDAFPPADYNDGVDMRKHPGGPYRPPHLTRSMPADLIRSEIVLSSAGSRPSSGEFRHIRRTDSPTFVGGNRTDSPVVFTRRVDSPAFMQGAQGFPMY